ncbi:MAG: FkbM family methyltransferase [Planctomycetota bacterium]|jgi:hypothetical protein|nr:FkbM family methyltransferase [Planctomycetota bacterium]
MKIGKRLANFLDVLGLRKRLDRLENNLNRFLCDNCLGVDLRGVDWEQYERDAAALKQNFAPAEAEKLERILTRMEKVALYEGVYRKNEIYSFAELKKFAKMNSIPRRVKPVENYYRFDRYKLPRPAFEPSIFYDKYELARLKTADRARKSGAAIFDAGALIGDSALILREFFPDNPLYAFEPEKTSYDDIFKTIQLNDLKNVLPVNLGLADRQGEMAFNFAGGGGSYKNRHVR